MSYKHCPGVQDFVRPAQIITRTCPSCGEEVEFFSDETDVKCPKCGHILHREATPSCVSWCQYADKCITDMKGRGIITPTKAEELEHIAKKKRVKSDSERNM